MSQTDARFVIAAAALWVCIAGLVWGTWTASGADSYGYISAAQLVLDRDLVVEQPIARDAPWPDADWTFAPLGYRPGPEPGTIVPVYPIGLPLVMALVQLVGGPQAVFLVAPLLGLVTVLAAAGLATRMASLTGGAMTALLLATSPTMLYAVTWPMSDVPATAWWALAAVLAAGTGAGSAAGAGVAAGLAVLTRPNLVGLAIAPGLYLVWRASQAGAGRRRAVVRLAAFTLPAVAACLAVAALHTGLYGAPLRSGHGELDQLFSTSLAPGNLAGFAVRPLLVEPALVVLALAGLFALARAPGSAPANAEPTGSDTGASRALAGLCLGIVALVLASYLFYLSYPEWWYLRFLLPAYPAAAALGGAGACWLAARTDPRRRRIALAVIALAVVFLGVWRSGRERIVRVSVPEQRYRAVGAFVDATLPERAVLLAFRQSGSLRYYGGRLTMRYDLLDPAWLDRAVGWLEDRGHQPYFVVERNHTLFESRFGGASPLGRLDWPPLARFDGEIDVEIFDPADRARWLAGEAIATQVITP